MRELNLHKAILEEHSKRQSLKIAEWVGNDGKKFGQLVDLFLNGEPTVVQRGAWIISHSAEMHPEMVRKFLPKLVKKLDGSGLHPAVKRNVVRILQFLPAPKKLHAQVINICFKYLSDPNETVAVRCFSMTVLENFARQYPEIKNELALILTGNLKSSSAGFIARSKKILKELRFVVD